VFTLASRRGTTWQLQGPSIGQEDINMSTSEKTIVAALEEIAQKLGGLPEVTSAAQTDPREELIVRYTIGSGKFVFVNNAPKILVQGTMYKLNGQEDGSWEGIDQPIRPITDTFKAPPQPAGPFDRPVPPVPDVPILSYSKGIFRFGDGSSITAIGPANIRVIYYTDGAAQLWVSGEQIITNGSGRYQGAQGLKTVGGSTWVPADKATDLTQAGTFSAKTIEVFRVIRSENIGPLPGQG
jgi:hypothetical protein